MDASSRARLGPPARVLAAVFVLVTLWAALGAGARASTGGRLTADEPQYLLSAISLAEDGDLDIADELAGERWRDFHRAELPRQTAPRDDGSELSPHDPLLPALLVPGVAVMTRLAPDWQHAELAGARVTMAVLAGALAVVLVWTAVARLGAPVSRATLTVAAFALPAPLAAYGSQLYPELPAALVVAGAAAAMLPAAGGGGAAWRSATWVAAVVALPWLGVKYVGVAAALALVGLLVDRRHRAVAVGALVLAGVAYLVFHQRVYGGWTVYAAGDHFVGGELEVVGRDPDHLGRSVRLLGLLVDRHFGLLAWAPVWAVGIPAMGWILRRRDRTTAVLVAPFVAGWATATWVALTMHGWWWPGRQVVVVLPLVVLAAVAFVDRQVRSGRRWWQPLVATLGAAGVLAWGWTVARSTFDDLRLIVDLDQGAGWPRPWSLLLPDQRAEGLATAAGNVAWTVVLAVLAVWGWRNGAEDSVRRHEDPLAGEGPDADGVAVDLDRGGAVRR